MATFVQPPPLATATHTVTAVHDLDVVIAAPENGDLRSFFDAWRPVISPYNLIIVATAAESVDVPTELHCDVYKKEDVERVVGSDLAKSLICKDSQYAARCLGVLLSKRDYICFLDENSVPARDAVTGDQIDPFQQHLINLQTPATPYFFNTLYDPYRPGADFVRGYPFSLRTGVATAISHGLGLLQSGESKASYVDLVLTVPKHAFFPMNGSNVAFNRKIIGPAMFAGKDLWAGLCVKVICDHLGYGVKSGLPYICCKKKENENEEDEDEEAKEWQEKVIPFFQSLQLPSSALTAEECYVEISKLLKTKTKLNFSPSAMEAWIQAWRK